MAESSMRLDKWLKISRLFKQRTKAERAIESGSVKLNGEHTKPAKLIKAGDKLTIKRGSRYINYTIKAISTKSIAAALARELYETEDPFANLSEDEKATMLLLEEQARKERCLNRGKPNKKERRQLIEKKYSGF